MRKMIIPALATMFSMSAVAANNITYTCTSNGAERTIEVVYSTPGEKLPCAVHYTKDGANEVLWTYNNELNKCESQAAAFAEKQATWGWQCNNAATQTDAAE